MFLLDVYDVDFTLGGTSAMGKITAVCAKCGAFKAKALGKCESCGLLPASAEDQARALMLSRAFDVGEEVIGMSPAQLELVAHEIQAGRPHQFDSASVARIAALHEGAKSVTRQRLLIDLTRWLLPPAMILVCVFWLIWHK